MWNQLRNEELFYHKIAKELGGVLQKRLVNGYGFYKEVRCPCCSKSKAQMSVGKRLDGFVFMCPVNGCNGSIDGWGCSLNNLIKNHFSDLHEEYLQNKAFKDNWFPIKNRQKPGPKKNFKKDQVKTPIDGLTNDLLRLKTRGQLEDL